MKIRILLFTITVALVFGLTGCGGRSAEIKKDARAFSDAMCRSIDNMHRMRAASQTDTTLIKGLQKEQKSLQEEMGKLHQDFEKKYGDAAKTPELNKQYRKYLSEAMLECKFLSKEDRALFEKEVK